MAVVDAKSNPRLYLIEKLILFVTMFQGPSEINDEYLDRFNSLLQSSILEGGKTIMCSLKTMDRVRETVTPEEVTTEEEKFKAVLFLLWEDESNYVKLFEDMKKTDFLGRA